MSSAECSRRGSREEGHEDVVDEIVCSNIAGPTPEARRWKFVRWKLSGWRCKWVQTILPESSCILAEITHTYTCVLSTYMSALATSSSFSPRNPVGLILKILFDVDKSGYIGVKVFARVPYLSRRNDTYSFSLPVLWTCISQTFDQCVFYSL